MTINKEILIYQNVPFKKYRWISYVSIIQLGFLGLNMIVLPTPKLIRERREALNNKFRKKERNETSQPTSEFTEEYEPNPDYDPATFFERFKRLKYSEIFTIRNLFDNIEERPIASIGLMTAAVLVTSAFWSYAHRMAYRIILLPNERVRFCSFSPLGIGKPPAIEVPLRDVSCVQDRHSAHNYSILKFKGCIGYHLVHKSEGQFLEPKLYDKHLGFARSWVQK